MAYAVQQDNYRSKRSYVSNGPFQNDIYTYTTALNPTTFRQEGRLAIVGTSPGGVTLTATNCPAGRVLRENGRKLYPGVNPGLAVGDTYQGSVVGTTTTNHFWVGVFDAVTGVKGFINPNVPTFSVYNSDKSLEVVDQDETNGTGVFNARVPIRTVTALGTSGAATLTAAQTVNGVVTQGASGTQALTLPATSAIISAMGDTVGTTSELVYINTAAQAVTVTAGDGNTTIVGSAAVNNTSSRFIIVLASATTVILYRA
jgi:hypothetical protein